MESVPERRLTGTGASPSDRTERAGAQWHLAWTAAAAIAAAVGAALGAWRVAAALAALAMPGILAQLARVWPGRAPGTALAFAWAAATGWALWWAGGLTGPIAPLAVMPAAAVASFADRRLVALAAALTLVVVVVLSLAGTQTTAPAPLATAGSVLAAVVAVAAALQLAGAESARREAVSAGEAGALRGLLEAAPGRVLEVGADGLVIAALGEVGGPGAPGEPLAALAGPADAAALASALGIARRTGAASLGIRPPHAPDRFLVVELRARGENRVVAYVRDATFEHASIAQMERRASEAEEAAAATSRFLANMSHELRTPLNAVIGFSDIMRSRLFGPLAARYAEYAGLIHESGGHLLDLINDVLDFSKMEADRFQLSREPFDAREAVAAALRLVRVQADAARIDLRAALPAEAIPVDADRRAIKQIVLNLVSNALKFTPPGGQVNVVARGAGPDLEIIVADTGVGIAQADLERLGRPFEQAGPAEQRARGTGLGLSLVRAFAELHAGAMTLKSALGEGTVVTVRLPVIDAAETRPAVAPDPGSADAGGPRPRSAALGDNVIVFTPHR